MYKKNICMKLHVFKKKELDIYDDDNDDDQIYHVFIFLISSYYMMLVLPAILCICNVWASSKSL